MTSPHWRNPERTGRRAVQGAALAKCSPDTALRDLSDLVERGILLKTAAGGRSTSYVLKRD